MSPIPHAAGLKHISCPLHYPLPTTSTPPGIFFYLLRNPQPSHTLCRLAASLFSPSRDQLCAPSDMIKTSRLSSPWPGFPAGRLGPVNLSTRPTRLQTGRPGWAAALVGRPFCLVIALPLAKTLTGAFTCMRPRKGARARVKEHAHAKGHMRKGTREGAHAKARARRGTREQARVCLLSLRACPFVYAPSRARAHSRVRLPLLHPTHLSTAHPQSPLYP